MSLTSIAGAVLAAIAFVVLAAIDFHPWAFAIVASIGAVLVIVLHHDNISRLRAGTERRVGEQVKTA
jgi:glycerol-3-phosphate acyltransferase PlsY